MQVRYKLLVKCPCSCREEFYVQFKDKFINMPISEKDMQNLKNEEDYNKHLNIETEYHYKGLPITKD